MRLLKGELTNFKQHQRTVIEFPPEGVIAVTGDNESGKSTIFNSLLWCLFGAKGLAGRMENLRWSGATEAEQAEARWTLDLFGRTLNVTRTEQEAEAALDGQIVAEGPTGVAAYIPTLLGMSLKEFEATHMCRQRDLRLLPSLGAADRERFVLDLLGVGRIELGIGTTRATLASLDTEVATLTPREGEPSTLDLKSRWSELTAEVESIETEGAALAGLREGFTARLEYLRTYIRLTGSKVTRQSALDQFAFSIKHSQGEITELQERANRAFDAAAELDAETLQRAEVNTALLDVAGRLTEYEALDVQRVSAREWLHEDAALPPDDPAQLQEELAQGDATSASMAESAGLLEGLKPTLTEVRLHLEEEQQTIDRLKAAKGKAACPTCAQSLSSDLLDDLLLRLSTAVSELRFKSEDLAHQINGHQEAVAGRDALTVTLGTLRLRISTVQARRARAAEYEWVKATALKKMEEIDPAESMVGRLSAYQAELTEHDERIGALRGEAAFGVGAERKLTDLRAQLAGVTTQAAAARPALAEVEAELAENAKDLLDGPEDLKSLEGEVERAGEQERTAAALLSRQQGALELLEASIDISERNDEARRLVAKDAGHHGTAVKRLTAFRTRIAGSIRPDLEALLSGMIAPLTGGRHDSVTVSESFGVILHKSGIPEPEVSGGCEDVAALALRVAVSRLIAERSGHPARCMILDEPMAQLDVVRRGNVLDLFAGLRTTFEQVIILSHFADVQDRVDASFHVTYDEASGTSSVERVL